MAVSVETDIVPVERRSIITPRAIEKSGIWLTFPLGPGGRTALTSFLLIHGACSLFIDHNGQFADGVFLNRHDKGGGWLVAQTIHNNHINAATELSMRSGPFKIFDQHFTVATIYEYRDEGHARGEIDVHTIPYGLHIPSGETLGFTVMIQNEYRDYTIKDMRKGWTGAIIECSGAPVADLTRQSAHRDLIANKRPLITFDYLG